MRHARFLRFAPLALLALLTLLAGCSRLGLAYRHLDTLIPFAVDRYVSLDAAQEKQLDAALSMDLAWHCQTQLPVYVAWLRNTRDAAGNGALDLESLRRYHARLGDAVQALAQRITPTAVTLLGELNDRQVAELGEGLSRDLADRREKYLERPLDEQVEERAERMAERLEPWIGRLSTGQQAQVARWSRGLGDHNRRWLDSRARWQEQLREALERRRSPQFATDVEHLLLARRSLWDNRDREAFQQAEQQTLQLLADLYRLSDDRQRTRLATRLGELSEELDGIDCRG